MLKIMIQDEDGAKIYYGTGVQMKQLKGRDFTWYECTIFTNSSFVKSGSVLLHVTDIVSIEEIDK